MNNKLLAVKTSSVLHYRSEIEKLEEALNVTRRTLEEVEISFSELIDYEPGDIMLTDKDVVVSFQEFYEFYGFINGKPSVKLKVNRLDSYGRLQNPSVEVLNFEKPWTLIKKAKIKEVDDEA